MPRRKEPRIPDAILDQLLAGADPKTVFDPNGLIDELKKALAERVLNAEMDHHLAGEEPGNRRNGYGKKTVITDTGQIELAVPRDREARFDPQMIAKYQRRFPGFDNKIISMYARGGEALAQIAGDLPHIDACSRRPIPAKLKHSTNDTTRRSRCVGKATATTGLACVTFHCISCPCAGWHLSYI